MKIMNRVLYGICIACIAVLTILSLAGIWAEIKSAILWKTVGSVFIVMLACAITLAINFHIQKLNGNRENRTE